MHNLLTCSNKSKKKFIIIKLGAQVINQGSQQAKSFLDSYANVDTLRPYFNVEPKDVQNRLIASFWPRLSKDQVR